MGDKIDILALVFDFLKGNKVLMVIVVSLLGGNIYQARGTSVPATKVTVITPKEKTVITQDCKPCLAKVKELIAELEKLKRWHE